MKYAGILISSFFLISCSAQWKSEFLAPSPTEGALNVELYNWETELYGGPSFGYVRPKLYGYKFGEGYYFIYPRQIISSGTIGPPIIPLGLDIPETRNDKYAFFVIRLFNQNNLYPVVPIKISLLKDNTLQVSCLLTKAVQDAVGIEYKCSKEQAFPENQPTEVVVEFSNQYRAEFPIESVKVSGYSPLFSFNGPNPRPKVVVHEKGGSISYPK